MNDPLAILVEDDPQQCEISTRVRNSTVCFRQEDATWESATVDADGNVKIQIPAVPSSTEILA